MSGTQFSAYMATNTPHSSETLIDSSVELRPSRSSAAPRRSTEQNRNTQSVVKGVARHTLGLLLLLVVVFLWTASNFLGSSIFANNSYAKPFFLTYINTATFILPLIPVLIRSTYQKYRAGELQSTIRNGFNHNISSDSSPDESQTFLKHAHCTETNVSTPYVHERIHLGWGPTARLSFTFCILWFLANYFAIACLQYTTVASTTILTSTSSIWTLLIGAATGTEKFTYRKLLGVLASLVGIVLTAGFDLTSDTKEPSTTKLPQSTADGETAGGGGGLGPSFPTKTPSELALGDILAFLSAIIYGIYTITLKRTTLKAAPLQLNMPLFFGLVGLFNTFLLVPLFPILSATGIEKFELPPSRRIWTILVVNSFSSLLSDICWAYAMLLTSPLVVTVGLSLTIPLSLVGEMVVQGRTEGWLYWIGAFIVVFSFVFVDREEVKDEPPETLATGVDITRNDDDDDDIGEEMPYARVDQSARNSEEMPR